MMLRKVLTALIALIVLIVMRVSIVLPALIVWIVFPVPKRSKKWSTHKSAM